MQIPILPIEPSSDPLVRRMQLEAALDWTATTLEHFGVGYLPADILLNDRLTLEGAAREATNAVVR